MSDVKNYTGTVTSLHVSGAGMNAGMLQTNIGDRNFEAKGADQPHDDEAYRHIFQGFVALLSASLLAKRDVEVGYVDDIASGKSFIHFVTLVAEQL